jgi:hypothetical protein
MIAGINDDKAVRYEGAAEIINMMLAHNTRALADEEAKAKPSAKRVSELNAERENLLAERRKLDPDDTKAIDHVYADYAPIVKRRFAHSQAA